MFTVCHPARLWTVLSWSPGSQSREISSLWKDQRFHATWFWKDGGRIWTEETHFHQCLVGWTSAAELVLLGLIRVCYILDVNLPTYHENNSCQEEQLYTPNKVFSPWRPASREARWPAVSLGLEKVPLNVLLLQRLPAPPPPSCLPLSARPDIAPCCQNLSFPPFLGCPTKHFLIDVIFP